MAESSATRAVFDQVLAKLQLESSADRSQLERELFGLTVPKLKDLCKILMVKVGTATKAVLVGRLLSQWQLGLFADGEEEALTSVSALKPAMADEIAQLPPFESVSTWSKDLRVLSDFTFMDLYTYLIESKDKAFDKESLKSFKSLKGYGYFNDGYVQNVWIHELTTGNYLYLRCHCFASLTIKQIYTVYICMSHEGTVYSAKCQCKAGLGQACSHVAALLFKLEDLKRKGLAAIPHDVTCTGTLQQWHVPPKRDVQPVAVKDITFPKAQYGKVLKPARKRLDDSIPTPEEAMDEAAVETFLEKVSQACPKSGLFHFCESNSGCDIVEASLMLPQSLDAQQMVIYQPGTGIPELAKELEGIAPGSSYFNEIAYEYMQCLTNTSEMIQFIEASTREQSASQLWLALHNGRITSSTFGEVMHRKDTTNPANLVSRIMGYSRLQYPMAAMKWDIEHEHTAQAAYVRHRRLGGCEVTLTGLTLYQSHPFLGASGDGLVTERGCARGRVGGEDRIHN